MRRSLPKIAYSKLAAALHLNIKLSPWARNLWLTVHCLLAGVHVEEENSPWKNTRSTFQDRFFQLYLLYGVGEALLKTVREVITEQANQKKHTHDENHTCSYIACTLPKKTRERKI